MEFKIVHTQKESCNLNSALSEQQAVVVQKANMFADSFHK
jgi:hypothetical protein